MSEPPRRPDPVRALPSQLEVVPLADEVVERFGYEPRSTYVETCWLPILGPTSTWLYRRLGTWATQNPDGLSVDTADLAVSLGLGEGLGRSSLLARGIGRLVSFGAAEWRAEDLAVRRALAPLTEHQVGRLSASAVSAHACLVAARH